MHFTVNGEYQGVACTVKRSELGPDADAAAMFPHVLSKNCAISMNMGQLEEPWFAAPEQLPEYTFCQAAPEETRVRGTAGPAQRSDCTVRNWRGGGLITDRRRRGGGHTSMALRSSPQRRKGSVFHWLATGMERCF